MPKRGFEPLPAKSGPGPEPGASAVPPLRPLLNSSISTAALYSTTFLCWSQLCSDFLLFYLFYFYPLLRFYSFFKFSYAPARPYHRCLLSRAKIRARFRHFGHFQIPLFLLPLYIILPSFLIKILNKE